jgi:hypothetical protein
LLQKAPKAGCHRSFCSSPSLYRFALFLCTRFTHTASSYGGSVAWGRRKNILLLPDGSYRIRLLRAWLPHLCRYLLFPATAFACLRLSFAALFLESVINESCFDGFTRSCDATFLV